MPDVGIPAELIRTELDKILASRVFLHAERASRFIRFVVEQTLGSTGTALKEYSIATAVLGRSETFDPRVDPIVRVEAGRLRSRLKEYYDTEGQKDPLVIDLPRGSYVPLFQQRQHSTAEPRRRGLILLVAIIALVGLAAVAVPGWTWLRAIQPIRSLAVLPLVNLSGGEDQEYFSDGLTEALITELGGNKDLRVISRTSVMRYKQSQTPVPQIARDLKVDAVVEGSVLRSVDRVRITMKLIRAASERQVWAETYERHIGDVLALQGEVARAVGAEVRRKVGRAPNNQLPRANPVAPQAVDAYLKARYWSHKRTAEGLRKAIDYYQQAIAADPRYPLAHSGLADAYLLSIAYDMVPAKQYFPRVRDAALRALELDATLAEPHLLMAAVRTAYEWDWQEAEKEYSLALKLEPGFAVAHQRYALGLMWFGRFGEALAEIETAQELDPLSPVLDMNECEILYNARQFQRAIEHCLLAIERTPQFFQVHRMLGEAYVASGRLHEAIAEFRTAIRFGGESTATGKLGHAYAVSGNRDGATAILRSLERSGRPEKFFDIAVIYAALGDKDRAFFWLERSYEERSRSLLFLKVAPVLDSLRGDPRFSDLVRRRFNDSTH